MNKQEIGVLSGIIISASFVPYIIGLLKGRIKDINLTTWLLWTAIGFSILVSYQSSGAEGNMWPVFFSFVDSFIVYIIGIGRRIGRIEKPTKLEFVSMVIFAFSLGSWFFVKGNKDYSQYSLYLAVIADLCAAVHITKDAWKKPENDRPFSWLLFIIGYGLSIWSLPDYSFASIVVPLYMCVSSCLIFIPLARYRILQKNHIKEWL